MVFGRNTVARRGRSASRLLSVGALLVLLATLFASGPAVALEEDLDVTLEPGAEFPASTDITVTIADLGDFDGGRAVVYQCGNADAFGAAIEPTEDDCFAPGNATNYLVLPIDGDTVEVTYPMRLSGIGDNNASCVPAADADGECQLVVAVSEGGQAILTGVSLDELVVAAQVSEIDNLPVTGLGDGTKLALGGLAAVLLYLGWFAWSAARPARIEATVRTDERR